MGCNTSADAKAAKEENGASATGANAEGKEKQNEVQNHKNEPAKGKDDKSPTEEEAATKIQAAFRGHQTRKSISMKSAKPQQQQQQEPEPTRAELEAEFRPDDKDLCNAATKIQASFRGHQARKVTQADKEKELQDLQDKEDIEKIDLADPDLNKAATKIQASFRGHKVRKDVPN